jgi:hypothetical protein
MTNPTHAQDVPGKGRWYVHPQTAETWPSITNVLDMSVAKQHQLMPWAVKITVEMAVQMMPRIIAAAMIPPCKPKRVADECRTCRPCLIKQLKRGYRDARDEAADLGTLVHKTAENRVLGIDYIPDAQVEPFVDQLFRFFDDYGVDITKDVVATEATVVNRKVGYAGTGDLWLNLRLADWPRKRLCLIDYKSSATKPALTAYPEQGMQLAALANGETLLLDDGTEVEVPGRIHQAFVLALRADSYALIPMPMRGSLDDAFTAFKGALPNATYLHSQYGAKPTAATPHAPSTTRKAS